jgi:hypothetical protein
MQAVAKNPAFAKKVGVPQSVGKEFTMKKATKFGKAMVKKSADTKGRAMKYAAGGMADRATKMQGRYDKMEDKFGDRMAKFNSRAAEATGDRKTRLTDRATQMGTRFDSRLAGMKARMPTATAKKGGTMKKAAMGGPLVNRQPKEKKMAAGGLAAGHKAADGVAKKGKTKGKMLAMGGMAGYKRGGKSC